MESLLLAVSDPNGISGSTLVTILVVLAILALLVFIFTRFWHR